MASRVFRATAAMINVLHKVLGLSIHVEGLENITERPTLFVVNHFTRMETFIVPYVLHKHAGRSSGLWRKKGCSKGFSANT